MIAGILCGPDPAALAAVGELLRRRLGRRARDEVRLATCVREGDLPRVAGARESWDVACVDIGDGGGLPWVRAVRALCPSADLLLVVDAGVSPMLYIRPGVMPSGLLQRPAETGEVLEALDDFAAHVVARLGGEAGGAFRIEGREGIVRVPYESIVCFESRAKRISVRTRREEHAYYDTLERLEGELPECFLRCHRSYIANLRRVRHLDLREGVLEMDEGSRVPVSRTYRARVRERLS